MLILDRLRELIAAQGLRPGDRLPPERQLAKQFRVSRPSLRGALDWLSERGALRRVQGGGTYLLPDFAAVLAQAHTNSPATDSALAEVVEARFCLEPVLVELAASRVSMKQLEALQLDLLEAGRQFNDSLAWQQHDLRFHTHLARLSGNKILSSTLESIFPRVLAYWQAKSTRLDLPSLFAEHQAILDALSRRDGSEAAQSMRQHLRSFQLVLRDEPVPTLQP